MKRPKGSSKTVLLIELTEKERQELTRVSKKWSASFREVIRAKIILMASRGLSHREISRRLNLGRPNVRRWIRRYLISQQQEELCPQNIEKTQESDQKITSLIAILNEQLKQNNPSAALSRLAMEYRKKYGVALSKSAISRFITKSRELTVPRA